MNRDIVSCDFCLHRQIEPGSSEHSAQVDRWVGRLLNKEPCVPPGYVFSWGSTAHNTAYLFDAAMCRIQYAQMQLQVATVSVGRECYAAATNAARSYASVLTEIMPQWSFRPAEVYSIPDTHTHDLHGHYYLARALAYAAIGQGDLQCKDSAQGVAQANAAFLFTTAAQLITGDVSTMVSRAEQSIGKALSLHGKRFLQQWDEDEDTSGASKALACYTEAHQRLLRAGAGGCQEQVDFAFARNQVAWQEPVLPDFSTLMRPRVTALS